MLEIGDTTLKHGMPRLALAFSDDNNRQNLKYYQSNGLDIAEIRVDLFNNQEQHHIVSEIKKFSNTGLTTLLTIRSQQEGGKWTGDESDRLNLLLLLMQYVDSVDIELSSLQNCQTSSLASMVCKQAKEQNKPLIISHHDFAQTPSTNELERIISLAIAFGADIVKIACHINNHSDIRVLTDVLIRDNEQRNIIMIGMGVLGVLSRISFPSYGSLLTFGCIKGMATAPGQPLFLDLFDALRLYYPEYNQEKISALKLLDSA